MFTLRLVPWENIKEQFLIKAAVKEGRITLFPAAEIVLTS